MAELKLVKTVKLEIGTVVMVDYEDFKKITGITPVRLFDEIYVLLRITEIRTIGRKPFDITNIGLCHSVDNFCFTVQLDDLYLNDELEVIYEL